MISSRVQRRMSSREAKRLACSIASIWVLSNLESGCLSNDVPSEELDLMIEELLDLEEAMHEISAELCRRGKNATGWHLVDMKGVQRKLKDCTPRWCATERKVNVLGPCSCFVSRKE